MVRYLQPDSTTYGYYSGGELLSLILGDFFKCGNCKRFQRYEGRFYALSELSSTVYLCCNACRQAGTACQPWPAKMQRTG